MVQDYLKDYPYVSRETLDKIDHYVSALLKWNQRINLVGRSTERDIWNRHIKDSIQLNQYLPKGPSEIIDLGTGAGLPGMVLAILRNDLNVTLVESNTKKTSFLNYIQQQLSLKNVTILNQRIEDISLPNKCYVITSRALASLNDLLNYSVAFSQKNTLCIFPKGSKLELEMTEAKENWFFDVIIEKSEVEQNSYIVLISNVVKRSL
ncbi:MAG: 16S rRNA (guanine(527)-N(7))-methyltransferase RsmG [Rickettsiales bacterium]|nr:16S rRNA (guanine(527)-N(7))-methyltransferase RsmG [Rickettsiales bacterium]